MKYMVAALLVLFAGNSLAQGFTPGACEGDLVRLNGVVTSTPVAPNSDDYQACFAQLGLFEVPGSGGQLYVSSIPELGDFVPAPVTCLKIEASGTAKVSGYSVLTTVPVVNPVTQGSINTPLCFPGDYDRGCAIPDGRGRGSFQAPCGIARLAPRIRATIRSALPGSIG